MNYSPNESGGANKFSVNAEKAIARFKQDGEFLTELLTILKARAKAKIYGKSGLEGLDAGDMAADAIIAVFIGDWTWNPNDGKRSQFGLAKWTEEKHSFCYRCCSIIWSRVDRIYKQSKRLRPGVDNASQGGEAIALAESSSCVGNPWTDTPIEVLICQDNWAVVQALLPKANTEKDKLLINMAQLIAHSSPVRNVSPTFSAKDIRNAAALARELQVATSALSKILWAQLSSETHLLATANVPTPPHALAQALSTDLNKVINGPSIDDPDLYLEGSLSKLAKSMLDLNPQTEERIRLRRLLLECAFPEHLSQRLHISYKDGLSKRRASWANRELAEALAVSEADIVNARRQFETILAPWLWCQFLEILPDDGRPWVAFANEAERPSPPAGWKEVFAEKHCMTVAEVVDMGEELLTRFMNWYRLLHRTAKTDGQESAPRSSIDEQEARTQSESNQTPIGRALERRLNRIKDNIQ